MAHRAVVRTVRTAGVLHILILVCTFFTTVLITLVSFRNIGFAADKILIEKLDKVGIKEYGFNFLRRLFGAVGVDGNGLFIVSCERYIILFQWLIPRFHS